MSLRRGADVRTAGTLAHEPVVSGDGLHPSDLGYERITERFADEMRRRGVPIS